MLSHVHAGNCPAGQAGANDYVPNGQPPFSSGNQFTQYKSYRFKRHSQTIPVQNSNNLVNRSDRGNNTRTEGMANHHWCQPPQPTYSYVAPSNSREMRNKAEKQRRDRLNSFIAELAILVPLVSKSAKRLDKTSILRLTATHLRIYQTLVKGKGAPQMELPPHVDQFVLEQLICDQMGGFLLIVNPAGKIIFISPTVETLLGHLQTDLMGQSLYTVTAPEDHDKLRVFLDCERENEQGWRKYFNIKIRRAGPKSETSHYESVRIMGVHRHLTSADGGDVDANSNGSGPSSSSMSCSTTSSLQTPINTDILVFFVKLYRPEPLADRLVAASKNEYVTRHLIDGRIIGCDQRISLIAGYMIEEVQGHSAFHYMHKDDVRFVMIALRQMYDRGENRGNSCYRLKSRNGQFIYLKTFGFLEIDDHGIVESFVCVNVEVDEDEGLHHIRTMQRRYRAMFSSSLASLPYDANNTSETVANSLTDNWMSPSLTTVGKIDRTEDPETLNVAINELMQNLPSPGPPESEPQTEVHSPERPTNLASPAPKHLHLRMKSSKRAPSSTSPDHIKRQRLTSEESQPPQLTPPLGSSALPYFELEEQYPAAPPKVAARHQHHQSA